MELPDVDVWKNLAEWSERRGRFIYMACTREPTTMTVDPSAILTDDVYFVIQFRGKGDHARWQQVTGRFTFPEAVSFIDRRKAERPDYYWRVRHVAEKTVYVPN